jgi:hypothetical protein
LPMPAGGRLPSGYEPPPTMLTALSARPDNGGGGGRDVAGAPEDGNPEREYGDEARQRAEARALAALLRGSGPQYPFPSEEVAERPAEPEAPLKPEAPAEPARPAEPEHRAEEEPPARPAARRRRVGRLVGVLLVLLFLVVAAIAGLGTWELVRSRARTDRVADELNRARTELGAIRHDLQDLRADFRALAEELPPDVPALLERVGRSVVAVEIGGKEAASGLAVEAPALPKGYRTAVLTRAWVARAASRGALVAVIHERRSFRVRLGKMDQEDGLALLFIKAALPSWPWASTDGSEPRVGEFVAAIGLRGRQTSGTTGVITAMRPRVVATDARLTPGSSGGPVVNRHGEVVGIARAGPNGLVTAIRIERACQRLVRC